MALLMDNHEDLKRPAEAPAQIAEDTSRCHRHIPPQGRSLSARASRPADWRGTKPDRHRWTTALRLTCCGDVFVVIVRWLPRFVAGFAVRIVAGFKGVVAGRHVLRCHRQPGQ